MLVCSDENKFFPAQFSVNSSFFSVEISIKQIKFLFNTINSSIIFKGGIFYHMLMLLNAQKGNYGPIHIQPREPDHFGSR